MASAHTGQRVYEFPLTGTMAGLLELEAVVQTLEEARDREIAVFRHLGAERLAGHLPELAPERLEASLIREVRRWTGYLQDLAGRPGADSGKVGRLRVGLDQLADRLEQDWPAYYQALTEDPWMSAYLSYRNGSPVIRLGPEAWAASPDGAARLERWLDLLAPVWTAGEAILRLLRDSLHRENLRIPREGHTLHWENQPASGLVEVQVLGSLSLPVFESDPSGVHIGLRSAERLSSPQEPVDAVVGWFTL
ncbi:hypothetical protein [Thiohalorhabdus methylotrophus]|uniref:Cell division protein ZapD n=1 Tax=Thiohalorhabdus methylotrophus TaxID=3242694 RepID=A0ABV4TPW6_9GAMM